LLTQFFEFYTRRFKPEQHVITIAHSIAFLAKSEYKEILRQEFKGQERLRDFMIEKIDKWPFVIVDPLDHSYNPGKTISSMEQGGKDYLEGMHIAHKRLIHPTKGLLNLDLSRLEK
jgi:hypothetical protein